MQFGVMVRLHFLPLNIHIHSAHATTSVRYLFRWGWGGCAPSAHSNKYHSKPAAASWLWCVSYTCLDSVSYKSLSSDQLSCVRSRPQARSCFQLHYNICLTADGTKQTWHLSRNVKHTCWWRAKNTQKHLGDREEVLKTETFKYVYVNLEFVPQPTIIWNELVNSNNLDIWLVVWYILIINAKNSLVPVSKT